MHKLYELLVPTRQEVLLYLLYGLALLVLVNIGALWQVVLHSTGTDVSTSQQISQSFHEAVANLTHLSDPQLVNGVVWGLTAALGFCLAVAVGSFLSATAHDEQAIRAGGASQFLEKLLIRIAGTISLLIFAFFGLFSLLPRLSHTFLADLSKLHTVGQGLAVAGCVLAAAAMFYAVAVLCRLITLRVRVFSSVIE